MRGIHVFNLAHMNVKWRKENKKRTIFLKKKIIVKYIFYLFSVEDVKLVDPISHFNIWKIELMRGLGPLYK